MKSTTKLLTAAFAALLALSACQRLQWTQDELRIIGSIVEGQPMPLTHTDVPADSVLLRTPCRPLSRMQTMSAEFDALVKGMLATVQDTARPGVGIAAPQVGVLRRLILVQRVDMEGEPFIPYVNPEIVWQSDSTRTGGEGCLSIPGLYGFVTRPAAVAVRYLTPEGPWTDTVSGFTATIFQHEIDHLNGILYTDRAYEIIEH